MRGLLRGIPLLWQCIYHSNCAPIIKRISNDNVKQSWYADAAAAGGILSGLRKWWDDLAKIGPDYGYFPNAKKTHLWLKITWTWSMPPDPPSFACLLLMYAYCSCMLTYTSDTHVTPLLKILATGLINAYKKNNTVVPRPSHHALYFLAACLTSTGV